MGSVQKFIFNLLQDIVPSSIYSLTLKTVSKNSKESLIKLKIGNSTRVKNALNWMKLSQQADEFVEEDHFEDDLPQFSIIPDAPEEAEATKPPLTIKIGNVVSLHNFDSLQAPLPSDLSDIELFDFE